MRGDCLDYAAEQLWKTPRTVTGAYTRDRGQQDQERLTLEGQAKAALWSTPRASDGEKGGPNQAFGAGGTPLPAQAVKGLWQTPAVGMISGGQTGRSGDRRDEVLINGQAAQTSLSARPDPETSTPGAPCSNERRSLNPLFVEMLMGWPAGWTSLAISTPEPTGFACSETAFTLWRRRMQSELSALGLPDAAPSVQPSLL